MRAPITPPNVSVPPTKAGHKKALFDGCKNLVGLALRYTIKYTYDPEEFDFIDFLDDVIKTLPMDEHAVPLCALRLFNNVARRSEVNVPRVVELVDESLPAPQPVLMHSSDGTSTMIEQVKTDPSSLGLRAGTVFEFKSNTPSILPGPEPYTLTFTPMASQSKSGPVVLPMSCDVSVSGELQQRDEPPRLDSNDDGHEGKKQSLCTSPSAELKPVTLPTRGKSTEQTPTPEITVPIASAESVGTIPAAQTSKSKGKSRGRSKSSKISARTPTKPQMLPSKAAARASIPFPSMGPASNSGPLAAATSIPAKIAGHQAPSVPDDKEDYPFAVNHSPPHPHATDGRPPPGGKVGLQRSYAFMHKSHPEIFWIDAWGKKPTEGQDPPVEGRSHPQTANSKGKMKSDTQSERERPTSGKSNSPVRIPSSSGSSMRAMMQLASKKQGKKRAREEPDADKDEERPNQRRRRASRDDPPKLPSRSLSAMWKKALTSVSEIENPFAK